MNIIEILENYRPWTNKIGSSKQYGGISVYECMYLDNNIKAECQKDKSLTANQLDLRYLKMAEDPF